MTKEEAIQKLKSLQGNNVDTERGHYDADNILCELLTALGCGDVVAEYLVVDKWYA